MKQCNAVLTFAMLLGALLASGAARADVFHMDPGLTSLEMVPVGNPGNAADTRYATPGYGAVAYEYQIGKYEVTAGQYTEFLNAVAKTDAYWLYSTSMWSDYYAAKIQRSGSAGTYAYSVAADRANRPVHYVSWGAAARFANWLSNGQPTTGVQTLSTTEDGSYYVNGATSHTALTAVTRKPTATWVIPTEDEWYKAAYHKNDGVTGNYFDYPTSSDSVPSNDLVNPDPGNNANFQYSDIDYTIGSPYYRTNVGEFENSESPYNTFDQGGNLWEWNETAITGSSRGEKGGSWFNYSGNLAASDRGGHSSPGWGYGNLGFRVARVPEPGSITLLVCGAVAGLVWWRRRMYSSRSA